MMISCHMPERMNFPKQSLPAKAGISQAANAELLQSLADGTRHALPRLRKLLNNLQNEIKHAGHRPAAPAMFKVFGTSASTVTTTL
jgi:hypothetical protein